MLILRKPSLQSVLWQKVAELHAYLVRCFCVGSGVKQFFDNQDVALFHRVKQRCLSFLGGNKSYQTSFLTGDIREAGFKSSTQIKMVIFRIRSEFSAEFSKDTVKFTIILRAT